jgi:hypothetical protein
MDIKVQPDRHSNLFNKTDCPEVHTDMARQCIVCGGKIHYVVIFQLTIQRIRNPANASNQGVKIIGYYSCPVHQPSHKIKYQLDFAVFKG